MHRKLCGRRRGIPAQSVLRRLNTLRRPFRLKSAVFPIVEADALLSSADESRDSRDNAGLNTRAKHTSPYRLSPDNPTLQRRRSLGPDRYIGVACRTCQYLEQAKVQETGQSALSHLLRLKLIIDHHLRMIESILSLTQTTGPLIHLEWLCCLNQPNTLHSSQ